MWLSVFRRLTDRREFLTFSLLKRKNFKGLQAGVGQVVTQKKASASILMRWRKSVWHHYRWLLLLLSLIALVAVAGLRFHHWLLSGKANPDVVRVFNLRVREGMTLPQIASRLHAEGILNDPRRFQMAARFGGLDRGIQQGTFVLSSQMSIREMLLRLQEYSVPSIRVTLLEGWDAKRIVHELVQATDLDSLRFLELIHDSSLAQAQGFEGFPGLEGLIFPDTYEFSALDSEEDILVRTCTRFREVLAGMLSSNMRDTLDLHRLVTLASIVQAEYQWTSEADTIAAVYLNRLKRGMKLQADPTVQYLLTDGPRRLLYRDLEIDSPYNTYRYAGLPPGPINSPGRVALKAVIRPARCNYLYFVARGDGRHSFARTYAQHLENRKPLDQLRRENRRQRSSEVEDILVDTLNAELAQVDDSTAAELVEPFTGDEEALSQEEAGLTSESAGD